jgi:RNA polymerase sigma-70 factor (ECF subfamily)
VGNHHDAEDLTEQTFLQAYRHFERAQSESAAGRCGRG